MFSDFLLRPNNSRSDQFLQRLESLAAQHPSPFLAICYITMFNNTHCNYPFYTSIAKKINELLQSENISHVSVHKKILELRFPEVKDIKKASILIGQGIRSETSYFYKLPNIVNLKIIGLFAKKLPDKLARTLIFENLNKPNITNTQEHPPLLKVKI